MKAPERLRLRREMIGITVACGAVIVLRNPPEE